MKILEAVREHPYIAGVGTFVVGVVLLIVIFSGSKSTPTTVVQAPTTDASAATQLQMAQLAATAQMHASDNALLAQTGHDASTEQLAKTAADANNNHDLNQYQTLTTLAQIGMNRDIGIATIGANVANNANALDAATNQAAIAAASAVQINADTIAGNVQSQGISAALTATLGAQGVTARANELAAQTASGQQYTDLRIADLAAQTQMALGYDSSQVAFSNNNAAIAASNNSLAATKAALAAGLRKSAA